jgi:hypothetical protein
MFRLSLLAILGVALLCVLFGAPQQPLPAEASGMQGSAPKQPQMDAPPAVSSVTASQLQVDSVFSHKSERFVLTGGASPHGALSPVSISSWDSIQASTVLRI